MAATAKKKTRLAQRTTREKILTILGRANSQKRQIKTTEDLVKFVERSKPVAFTYFRTLPNRPSGVSMCTLRLIRERVQLCIDLELIDEQGHLTKIGTATLRATRPERRIAAKTISFLQVNNFDVEQELSAGLQHPGRFPTAARLYNDNITLKQPAFRRLLNLLADCGHLYAVQSRMYFISRGM